MQPHLALVSLLLTTTSAVAATSQRRPDALVVCTHEADSGRRLACYDRYAGFSPPAVAAVTVAAPAIAAPDVAATSGASRSEQAAQVDYNYGLPAPVAARAKQLEARVVAVTHRVRGELVITLDNDQVWLQTESDMPPDIKIGAMVTIVPAALGSFWLRLDSKHGMRVKRLR